MNIWVICIIFIILNILFFCEYIDDIPIKYKNNTYYYEDFPLFLKILLFVINIIPGIYILLLSLVMACCFIGILLYPALRLYEIIVKSILKIK